MKLRPLGKNFLFEFINETAGGRFIETTRSGIIMTNQNYDLQSKYARWGRVAAVGDEVADFAVGDIVLISYGRWTTSQTFEGTKLWKSDEEQVIAIGNDESVAYF